MLLFKYFKKTAKDDLPDPNGPLSLRAYTLGQTRVLANLEVSGARRISVKLGASKEKNSCPAFYACNLSWIYREQDCFLK